MIHPILSKKINFDGIHYRPIGGCIKFPSTRWMLTNWHCVRAVNGQNMEYYGINICIL